MKNKKSTGSKTKRTSPKTKTPPETTAAASETVERLQQLAEDLASASKEAEQIAEVVQTGLAHELLDHQVDAAAKKKPDE
jgi:hypothetical protein